jgi:hypothetical protein
MKSRSCVVTDPKGETCAITRKSRRRVSEPVVVFYDKAKRLTLAIIETEDDPQKFFPESAQGLLTAGIMWEVMQDLAAACLSRLS